jgi:hypothetical protein
VRDNHVADHIEILHEQQQLKQSILNWIEKNDPPSLGVFLAEDNLKFGSLFTHHSNFYFSGLSKFSGEQSRGKSTKLPTAYSKLAEWKPNIRVKFDYSPDHLTSSSAWSALGGQKRMFVLAAVTDIGDTEIACIPYVIANIVDTSSSFLAGPGPWANHLELYIDQIESFSQVENFTQRHSRKDLDQLRNISESEIKSAFAEIVNEPSVPKDWGGESSDLFSSRVILDGHRVSSAFLLKGPAKFHPMTPADLGKNGDQIGRLFDEPADLLFLQHCHEVTTSVRKQMRAYAERMGRPRQFCIIDGFDTIRILRAYKKCGFVADPNDEGG